MSYSFKIISALYMVTCDTNKMILCYELNSIALPKKEFRLGDFYRITNFRRYRFRKSYPTKKLYVCIKDNHPKFKVPSLQISNM